MSITPIYAALLGILFIVLSVRIIRLRQTLRLPIGDAGNIELIRIVRAQSNFAEYVPLALLLLVFLEHANAPTLLIHALCLLLLIGRTVHAYGISQINENITFRVTGMMMTLSTIALTCLSLLTIAFLPT